CAMAGLLSERSGIVDIGLEGKMLAAAFAAASVAAVTGSPSLALALGIVIATALALLHRYACITQHRHHGANGVALNPPAPLLASGLPLGPGRYWFHQGGQPPLLTKGGRFLPIELPGAVALGDIPLIGPIYRDLVSGHNLIVYIALLSVPATHWLVNKTRFG